MVELETIPLDDVPEDGLFLIMDTAYGLHLLKRDGMMAHDIAETREIARWAGYWDVGKIYGVRLSAQVAYTGVILSDKD